MIVKNNCKVDGNTCPMLEKRTGTSSSKYYYRCLHHGKALSQIDICELAGSPTLQQEEFKLKKIIETKGEITMAERMKQTLIELKQKVNDLLEAKWPNVVEAYINHDFSFSANIKIVMDGESINLIDNVATLSFYPLPKTEIKTDKFRVDEKQLKIFETGD